MGWLETSAVVAVVLPDTCAADTVLLVGTSEDGVKLNVCTAVKEEPGGRVSSPVEVGLVVKGAG